MYNNIKTSMGLKTFFISYALPDCHTEQVREVFDNLLQDQVVEIVERTLDDKYKYKPGTFKQFFVTIDACMRFCPGLTLLEDAIETQGFARVVYRKTNKGVDRYWKVRAAF